MTARTYLYVAAGGAVGALARHAAGEWVTGWAGQGFPWGTLLINISGTLLLGFLVHSLPRSTFRIEVRALLTVGLCGGFTTFSAFAYEAQALLATGRPLASALYIAGSLGLGTAAAYAGALLGRPRTPPRPEAG